MTIGASMTSLKTIALSARQFLLVVSGNIIDMRSSISNSIPHGRWVTPFLAKGAPMNIHRAKLSQMTGLVGTEASSLQNTSTVTAFLLVLWRTCLHFFRFQNRLKLVLIGRQSSHRRSQGLNRLITQMRVTSSGGLCGFALLALLSTRNGWKQKQKKE